MKADPTVMSEDEEIKIENFLAPRMSHLHPTPCQINNDNLANAFSCTRSEFDDEGNVSEETKSKDNCLTWCLKVIGGGRFIISWQSILRSKLEMFIKIKHNKAR